VKKRSSAACGSSASTPAVRAEGLTYSQFIHGTKLAGIELDRKAMADLAMNEGGVFTAIIAPGEAGAGPADLRPYRLIGVLWRLRSSIGAGDLTERPGQPLRNR